MPTRLARQLPANTDTRPPLLAGESALVACRVAHMGKEPHHYFPMTHTFGHMVGRPHAGWVLPGENLAGLSGHTPFYNISTAAAMMVGRFFLPVPALIRAGRRVTTPGTLPPDSLTFAAVALGATSWLARCASSHSWRSGRARTAAPLARRSTLSCSRPRSGGRLRWPRLVISEIRRIRPVRRGDPGGLLNGGHQYEPTPEPHMRMDAT